MRSEEGKKVGEGRRRSIEEERGVKEERVGCDGQEGGGADQKLTDLQSRR